jgi:(2Fe-2S) ferredoxin
MKQCKAGPNVVMPDKTRYTRIGAEEIPDIIDKHFPNQTVSQPTAKIIQKSAEHNQQQVTTLVY